MAAGRSPRAMPAASWPGMAASGTGSPAAFLSGPESALRLPAGADPARSNPHADPQGMVRIEGGAFLMGSDRHYPEEGPQHRVEVGSFFIDATPVTNRQYAAFVRATGYVTVAERKLNAGEYPGAAP